MSRTQALLESILPHILSTLTHDYLKPTKFTDYNIALAGHGELCLTIRDWNSSLRGACEGGHRELADLMIARGANKYNSGLQGACSNGHRELAELMIARGANCWNFGLHGACSGGHRELAELMILHGATYWNMGLYYACQYGNRELIKLMIAHGASICVGCKRSIKAHT